MDFNKFCKEHEFKEGYEKLVVVALNEKLHDTIKKKYHDRPKTLYLSLKDAEDLLGSNFTGLHKVGEDEDGNINYKFASGHQLGYYEACTAEQVADGHTIFSIKNKKSGLLINEDIALLYEPPKEPKPKTTKKAKQE